jgi:hypothetical protein
VTLAVPVRLLSEINSSHSIGRVLFYFKTDCGPYMRSGGLIGGLAEMTLQDSIYNVLKPQKQSIIFNLTRGELFTPPCFMHAQGILDKANAQPLH